MKYIFLERIKLLWIVLIPCQMLYNLYGNLIIRSTEKIFPRIQQIYFSTWRTLWSKFAVQTGLITRYFTIYCLFHTRKENLTDNETRGELIKDILWIMMILILKVNFLETCRFSYTCAFLAVDNVVFHSHWIHTLYFEEKNQVELFSWEILYCFGYESIYGCVL